jgi:hypothetical protein
MVPVRYAASPESDKKGRAALTHQGCRQCEKKKKGCGGKRQDGGYQGAAVARALLAEQQASWSEEEKTYGWWGSEGKKACFPGPKSRACEMVGG